MSKSVQDRVNNVMSAVFEITIEQINENSSPDTIESWDSLKHMNLVIALEEEFDTEIPDEEAEKITTVQQAIDYVNKNL